MAAQFEEQSMRVVAFRYALAPVCILLAVLVYLSPARPLLSLAGLFVIAVLAAAWFGGAGPGFVAALIATFTLPQLIAVSYPLLGGFLDLPRFTTFSIAGLVVGWWSLRRRQVEAALRESEKRYELVLSAGDEGFWDWTLAGDKLYLSPRFAEIFGITPGTTFAGRAAMFQQLTMPSEDREALEHVVAEHFAGRTVRLETEFRVLVEGEVRWIHVTGRATRNPEGEVVRWSGAARDITERKRGEEALRMSEQRFALAVAGSYNGVWDVDFVARRVFFSARTRELCGLPPGPEVVPLDGWFEALPLHLEDRPKRNAALETHLSGRSPAYEGEFRLRQLDGVYRWRHLRGVCVRDAEGKPLRMAGSISDVDARRSAEEALRLSEERYELAMSASESGYWDWKIPTGEYFASPRAMELAGFPRGSTFVNREQYRARINMHPDDFARWESAREELFAGTGERLSMEVRYMVNGEPRWHILHAICSRDDTGKVVRWAGSATDITARKLAEDALRESERRYELAMAASESGYWDWNIPNRRYFASSRANEMIGLPADNTYADRADFRARVPMHPEDWARWEAARNELFAGTGEHLAMECRYFVRGEQRWHSLQAICKRDDKGQVVRWIGSTTDITERKRAEEGLKTMERKLRQAQRLEAMGTLAGGIAHDFNNILGAILGYGEMALRDAPKASRLARDIDGIMVAGERARVLVDRVLAFSRGAVSERVPVHVERVVREVLDLVSAKLPSSVTVHKSLRAGRAAVLGDATQVHQVATNLATNAIQAMPTGGTLSVELAIERVEAPCAATIGARGPGEYVVLTVADTGAGMAPAIVERIFDPFFTTKEVGTGTGLGLSLVHGIVTELGGAIDVASNLGNGSTFTVYLPRSGDAAQTREEEESPLPRGDGQHVLIVDDEEPLVELATRALADLGYVPIGFTSSASALALFRADPERFDALITDERMPGMSGSALIREVRSIRNSMPVVLMSGYLGATTEEGSLPIGAHEVLQKPLSARDLATSLARVFRL